MTQAKQFLRPSLGERVFNRLFGAAVGMGLGLKHNYLVEVRGRVSGKLYSAPVDVLELEGRRYLVAPRGETNWVRNARAAGGLTLRKGSYRADFRVREAGLAERPAILKAYLDRFATTVQRYFPVSRGCDASDFASIADRYPVFELRPQDGSQHGAGR